MKLILNIKPTSQKFVSFKPHGTFYVFNNLGDGWTNNSKTHFVGIVAHKVRKKTKQYKDPKTGKTTSVFIRKAGWVITSYNISFDLLKGINAKFTQKSRHFTITINK